MAVRRLMQTTSHFLLWSVKCSQLTRLYKPGPLLCRFFSLQEPETETQSKENNNLVSSLEDMGVNIEMARKRQPGVLKKMITYEEGLTEFLQGKGATKEFVARIITRYPRSITRTLDHLEKKWEIWYNILNSDSEILAVVERAPEAFFRSSNITNLEKNIEFLSSLGLTPKDLSRLLAKAPRTFSNRLELNQQMVLFLNDMHVSLGGKNTQEFVKQLIIKNIFILIQSVKRVKTNIEFLQTTLKLTNEELLNLLQGYGASILDLCHEYIKRNFRNIRALLLGLGCTDDEISSFIVQYPPILYLPPNNFNDKIDCLLEAGIQVQQILEKPRAFDFSIDTMTNRISRLQNIGYNFDVNGIGILELSKPRFETRFRKLNV